MLRACPRDVHFAAPADHAMGAPARIAGSSGKQVARQVWLVPMHSVTVRESLAFVGLRTQLPLRLSSGVISTANQREPLRNMMTYRLMQLTGALVGSEAEETISLKFVRVEK